MAFCFCRSTKYKTAQNNLYRTAIRNSLQFGILFLKTHTNLKLKWRLCMFIPVITNTDYNFEEVTAILISRFGYNEAYWRRVDNAIHVYYKDIYLIEHLI